ncbi:hypothetical protein D7Y35_02355, partial [Stenotrophomonas maltophilia]|nr:hypothetical protein [Stenotrophomonas maltophilia]
MEARNGSSDRPGRTGPAGHPAAAGGGAGDDRRPAPPRGRAGKRAGGRPCHPARRRCRRNGRGARTAAGDALGQHRSSVP